MLPAYSDGVVEITAEKRRRESDDAPGNENSAKDEKARKRTSSKAKFLGSEYSGELSSEILYATPLQSKRLKAMIGKAAVRTLQSNFHSLKTIVTEELESFEECRLASLNFKTSTRDKE
jgi:hypothetical protein